MIKTPTKEDLQLALGPLAETPSRFKRIMQTLHAHSAVIDPPGLFPFLYIGPDDWLSNVDEDGQSYESFLSCFRNVPDKTHNVLYIQPFDGVSDKSLLELLEKYAKLHFTGIKVEVRKVRSMAEIKVATRIIEGTETKQYLATSIIETLAGYK